MWHGALLLTWLLCGLYETCGFEAHRHLRAGDGPFVHKRPFDMDPNSWMKTLNSIPTDVLALFYSTTCRDCHKILPQWIQLASELDGHDGLTFLTVADPKGLAPGAYSHDENPAIFFAKDGNKSKPFALSVDDVHAFTYTRESAATVAALRNAIIALTKPQLNQDSIANHKAVSVTSTSMGASPAVVSETDGPDLTARFLTILGSYQHSSVDKQLQLAQSSLFCALPVAQHLLNLGRDALQKQGEPLVVVAARFLDGTIRKPDHQH
mmetsp:Transcript_110281/g.213499  ORF Transcript_110281/g.213499 Transcript_110281/m.213499 type:complete len:266 (+) Transcript_110281:56-853(+)